MTRDTKGKFKVEFFKELWRKRNGIFFTIVTIVALWPTAWDITQSFVEFPEISYAKVSTIEVEQTLEEELNQKAIERFEKNKNFYMEDAKLQVLQEHNDEFRGILRESLQSLSATSTK